MGLALCTGCFAAITPTHVAYLMAASKMIYLRKVWVAIMSRELIHEYKGHDALDDYVRCKMLATLDCVNGVVVQDTLTPEPIIRRLQPILWIKGGDYQVSQLALTPEGRAVLECGGEIRVTARFNGPSTTELLNVEPQTSFAGRRDDLAREGRVGIGRRLR